MNIDNQAALGRAPEYSVEAISTEMFEGLVADALDALPEEMIRPLDNVVFVVEDEPESGQPILGEYVGFSLAERENYGHGEMPDHIVLYRRNLIEHCDSWEALRAEIRITLVHEIAHFYGLDEARIHELGWG